MPSKSSTSRVTIGSYLELIQMKEELKAALRIAYPNYEGLGEWEPAVRICEEDYDF